MCIVYFHSYNREVKFRISSKSANTSSLKPAPYFSSGTTGPENGDLLYASQFQEGERGKQSFKLWQKSFEMVVLPASRNCYPTNAQLVWILAFKLICVFV